MINKNVLFFACIFIMLSSFCVAYNVGEVFNVTQVPLCNNYNIINIRSDTVNVSNTSIYPFNCTETKPNYYNCNCSEDNIIWINSTQDGIYSFFISYFIADVSLVNETELLDYSKLYRIDNVQIGLPKKKPFLTSLTEDLDNSIYTQKLLFIIIGIVIVIILVAGFLFYKFLLIPFLKER